MSIISNSSTFPSLKKAGSLFDEFKAFAFKGNVVDLAVGVIIGAAFGSIIKSLVDNIIMPLVSLVLPGEQGYEKMHLVLSSSTDPKTNEVVEKTLNYGKFLGEVINFVIVAIVLFLFIKLFLGWLMRAKKEEVAAPPPMSKDQVLLTEIRDLLKQSKQ